MHPAVDLAQAVSQSPSRRPCSSGSRTARRTCRRSEDRRSAPPGHRPRGRPSCVGHAGGAKFVGQERRVERGLGGLADDDRATLRAADGERAGDEAGHLDGVGTVRPARRDLERDAVRGDRDRRARRGGDLWRARGPRGPVVAAAPGDYDPDEVAGFAQIALLGCDHLGAVDVGGVVVVVATSAGPARESRPRSGLVGRPGLVGAEPVEPPRRLRGRARAARA